MRRVFLKNRLGGVGMQVLVPMSLVLGSFMMTLYQENIKNQSLAAVQNRTSEREEFISKLTTTLGTTHGCSLNLGTDPGNPSAVTNKNILLSQNASSIDQNYQIAELGMDGLVQDENWLLRFNPQANTPVIGRARSGSTTWELASVSLTITGTGHYGNSQNPPLTTGSFLHPLATQSVSGLSLHRGEFKIEFSSGLNVNLPINYWTQDLGNQQLVVGCIISKNVVVTTQTGNIFQNVDDLCNLAGGYIDTSVVDSNSVSPATPRCRLDHLYNQALDPTEQVSSNLASPSPTPTYKPAVTKYREVIFSQWVTSTSPTLNAGQCSGVNNFATQFIREQWTSGQVTSPADLGCMVESGGVVLNDPTCPTKCYYPLGNTCTINNGPGMVHSGGRYRCVNTYNGYRVGGSCYPCTNQAGVASGLHCLQQGMSVPSPSGPVSFGLVCSQQSPTAGTAQQMQTLQMGWGATVCPSQCRY